MFKDKRTAMVGTLVLALFLLSLTLTNPGKVLAVDAFLKIDGVEGESRDAKHQREIDVISWTLGETNSGTFQTGGGGGAGKVKMQDFKFTMRTNAASPKLFQACASGQHLSKAVLTARSSSSKTQVEFLQITLSDSIVSSFLSMGNAGPGGADAYPMEEIMLNFSTIKISYTPMKADGTPGGPIPASWNVQKNSPQ